VIPAGHAGRCAGCGEDYPAGTEITHDGNGWIAVDCCGDVAQTHGTVRGSASTPDPEAKVMPRGKTKRDRCPHCFQIPATSNVCGCN